MIQFVDERNFVLQSLDQTSPAVIPHKKAILMIKANWCGHCIRYLPTFEEYSIKNPHIQFFVLESEQNEKLLRRWQQLATPAFRVDGYPTLVLYDEDGHPKKVI